MTSEKDVLKELRLHIRLIGKVIGQLDLKESERQELMQELQEIAKLPFANQAEALTVDSEKAEKELTIASEEVEEEIIVRLLREVGTRFHLKGYRYIKEAVMLGLQDETYFYGMVSKRLYPDVAKKFNTTPSRVERAIRHWTELIWLKGNIEKLDELFSYGVDPEKGKPTNSEFIAMLIEEVKREMK